MLNRGGSTSTSITLEYELPGKWLTANLVTAGRDGERLIEGLHINPMDDSLEHANRFTLVGKGVPQYTILVMALLSPLLSIMAFVECLRAKLEKRKWLWALATLVGAGRLAVNWTTGQTLASILWVSLPPGGATAPLYGPWTVSASLPLGALIFFAHRRTLTHRPPPPSPIPLPE